MYSKLHLPLRRYGALLDLNLMLSQAPARPHGPEHMRERKAEYVSDGMPDRMSHRMPK